MAVSDTQNDKSLIERTAAQLEKNCFKVHIADSAEDAKKIVLSLVSRDESAGFGGSETVRALGLVEALEARGNRVFFSKFGMPVEKLVEVRRSAMLADAFMASPNAVTADGRLMFWESIGNRTAGMTFGPKKVIAIAGVNKIVADEEAGWRRMKTYTCPANCRRLKLQTPCTVDGVCHDCSHPQRICNIRVVLDKKPKYTEYHVILVPETLGY